MSNIGKLQVSDYRMRKLIGILGLCLPFILPIVGDGFLGSISHYYYNTLSSLVFIIILSSFALFLISYKGYSIDKDEKISDDIITNIGGFAALIVVIIPTCCSESQSDVIELICTSENYPLLGHSIPYKNTIHLISAGIFIFSMGWMSKYKFPRGDNDKYSLENKIYKICGNIVWGAIALLIIIFSLERFFDFDAPNHIVYIMETVAIVPFGISWLVKGQTMTYVRSLGNKYFKRSQSIK